MRVDSYPQRVPSGPQGHPLIGNLLHVQRDRLGLMLSAAREYGDAVRIRMGPKTLYLFNNPDHAKHVLSENHANYRKGLGLVHARRALGDGLLTSEGELWRSQRRAVQPAFQRERVAQAAGVIAEEADRMLARWRARPGSTIDVVAEMTALTLGVLGRFLLRAELGSSGHIGQAFEAIQDQAMFEMVTLNAVPPWLPLPRQLRFRRARRDLDALVQRLVSERVDGPERGDDLLSRLLVTTGQEADPRVRRRRLRDELVTLLLAGHETTASTLGWTWYLVDRHPEVFERLHAEASETLGDRMPDHEDLSRLTFTTRVVEEAIRLYPPVWMLTRQAVDDDDVNGYHVPAGADVLICPYVLHRHPGFWERPESFDPERFRPAMTASRPRYAYIPFGAGPRFCVGSNLGLMEAVLVVAMIAREFQLRRTSSDPVAPEPMLSLRLRGGLPVVATPI
jgi:enediyne biosynthesis protein E7